MLAAGAVSVAMAAFLGGVTGFGYSLVATPVLLARSVNAPPPRRIRGAPLVAGFFGGFLGSSTSLNGVAPVLLLARDKASPRSFLADLAMYFVGANAIGLLVLAFRRLTLAIVFVAGGVTALSA